MKTLYIIAGANGSGKTTFAKTFSEINSLYFINADEIAKTLAPDAITKHQVQAGRVFFHEMKKRLQDEKSFVIETTLSGNYLVKYIKKAQERGFIVEILYLFLEKPQTNISRVANRVLNGGHHVPEDDIIRRFYRSKKMFITTYKVLANRWTVYYNSDEVFEKVATEKIIYDEMKWLTFQKDIS